MKDFYKNMVIFGLAPSTEFLQNALQRFEEKVRRPAFTMPKELEGPNGVPNLAELAKLKPSNKYFVYRVDRFGCLHVSHTSLETLLELCQLNKFTCSLIDLLRRHLIH